MLISFFSFREVSGLGCAFWERERVAFPDGFVCARGPASRGLCKGACVCCSGLVFLNEKSFNIPISVFEYIITNNGEVAQWSGHRIANRKVSISSPALPILLRVSSER